MAEFAIYSECPEKGIAWFVKIHDNCMARKFASSGTDRFRYQDRETAEKDMNSAREMTKDAEHAMIYTVIEI